MTLVASVVDTETSHLDNQDKIIDRERRNVRWNVFDSARYNRKQFPARSDDIIYSKILCCRIVPLRLDSLIELDYIVLYSGLTSLPLISKLPISTSDESLSISKIGRKSWSLVG